MPSLGLESLKKPSEGWVVFTSYLKKILNRSNRILASFWTKTSLKVLVWRIN